MNVTKKLGYAAAFAGSAIALVFVLVMGFLYVLHGGVGGGGESTVDAKENLLLGSWRGSGGTTIDFKPQADFAVENWPTFVASGWTGAAYSGKWEIQNQPRFGDMIHLYFYPEITEESSVPEDVVMVRNSDGSLGLCPMDDSDSPCGLGVLRKG
jgi:hypothetical protein